MRIQITWLGLFVASCSAVMAQSLVSLNPDSAEQGRRLTVTIVGQNTHFIQASNVTYVWMDKTGAERINPSHVTRVNNLELRADFSIPSTAPAGSWEVNAQNTSDGRMTLPDGFTITLGAPTNLAASIVSGTEIKLSWTDKSGTAEDFEIERKKGPAGAYEKIATVGGDETVFVDTGLALQTQYCYRVRAFTNEASSGYSNESCAITTSNVPQLISAAHNFGEQGQTVTLTVTGINTHFAQAGLATSARMLRGDSAFGALEVTPINNTTLVAVFNIPITAGHGLWNVAVENSMDGVVTLPDAFSISLGTPSDLTATPVLGAQVNLNWSDRSGSEDGFIIERKLGAGGIFEEIARVGKDATSFQNTGLEALTEYCFRVRAFNGDSYSSYSAEVFATTLGLPQIVSIDPSIVEQGQTIFSKITCRNTRLVQSSHSTMAWFEKNGVQRLPQYTTVTSDTTLVAEFIISSSMKVGRWGVKVQNSVDGLMTLPAGLKVKLARPSVHAVAVQGAAQINVNWSTNSGTAQGVKIERRQGKNSAFQEIAVITGDANIFADTEVSAMTEYCYRIRSFQDSLLSRYSEVSCATTTGPGRIVSLSPTSAQQSQKLTVTIIGESTNFLQGSGTQRVWFVQGTSTIDATAITPTSNTSLRAELNLSANTRTGNYEGFVENVIDGKMTSPQNFNIRTGAPSNLSAVAITERQIDLHWTDNSGTEWGFKIQRRRADSGTFQEIASVGNNVTVYHDSQCEPGVEYCYRVYAYHYSSSNPSNQACVTTPQTRFTQAGAGLTGVSNSAVAWGDYDDDGDLDLLLAGATSAGPNHNPVTKLYRNNSNASGISFVEVNANLAAVWGGAVAWGDFDLDDDLDILLTGNAGSSTSSMPITKVYRNAQGNFSEVPEASLTGVWRSTVAWGDLDHDGDLDIALAGLTDNGGAVTKLYRNLHPGISTAPLFVEIDAGLPGVSSGSVALGDYDWDNDVDILLAGRSNAGTGLAKVYRNDDSIFADIGAPLQGVTVGSASWGDFDQRFSLDILLNGFEGAERILKVYREENGTFYDIGVSFPGPDGFAAWGDYDNDGDFDVLATGSTGFAAACKIFEGNGERLFETDILLQGVYTASQAVWGDVDNDDDLDFVVAGDTVGTDASPVTIVYRNNIGIPNTPPAPPTNLSSLVGWNGATLRWHGSSDGQTSAAGLSYNVRVRDARGRLIVTPMADSTGFRRIAQLGNAGPNHSFVLENLSSGVYFWSVQAIDNAFVGSAFSEEQSFAIDPGRAYALVANKIINFDRFTKVEGEVFSNRDVAFRTGKPSVIEGNLTAFRDVVVAGANTIQGNLTAGGAITIAPDATITGTVTAEADVDRIPLPTFTWGPFSGPEIAIPAGDSMVVTPGDYMLMRAYTGAIMKLSSGTYNTNRLILDDSAQLKLDLSGGPIEINVVNMLLFRPGARIIISTTAGRSTDISINYKGIEMVVLASNTELQGNFTAPQTRVKLGHRASFLGSIRAKRIDVYFKSHVRHHSVPGGIPQNSPATAGEIANEQLQVVRFALLQNYPNPFNPETIIHYALPQPSAVRLEVFDHLGRLVRTLMVAHQPAGRHAVSWDGRNEQGMTVPSGVYLYRLTAGPFVQLKKMLLMK